MTARIIICLMFLNLLFQPVKAQDRHRETPLPALNLEERKKLADTAATILKNGALIVMLKQNQRSINAYRNAGQEKIAQRVERRQRKENLLLVNAFRKHFNFCKFYFVYTKDIDSLKAGVRKGIFLNDSLQYDADITMPESDFLIGNIDILYERAPLPSDCMTIAHTGTALYDKAFVISYPDMIQLRRPFPRAVRIYASKSYSYKIRILNRRITRYYKYYLPHHVSGKP